MGAYKRKSWQEKLNDGRMPHLKKATKAFAGISIGEQILIPTPRLIDDYIRQLPEGSFASNTTLRNDLALAQGAAVTCPLTTGIFLRIVAEAAYEAYKNGNPLNEITPFWRAIDETSTTAKKLSFGTAFLVAQRKKEASPVHSGGGAPV